MSEMMSVGLIFLCGMSFLNNILEEIFKSDELT